MEQAFNCERKWNDITFHLCRNPPKVMATIASDSSRSLSAWADSVGSTGALLCAIHCAALPLLLGILPALGLGLFASEGFERGFVLCAAALGSASLGWSYRRHRQLQAWAWLSPGLITLGAGTLIPGLHAWPVLHAVVMTTGGALVSAAHFINLRMTRRHDLEPCCRN
jgi:hypothetical protein